MKGRGKDIRSIQRTIQERKAAYESDDLSSDDDDGGERMEVDDKEDEGSEQFNDAEDKEDAGSAATGSEASKPAEASGGGGVAYFDPLPPRGKSALAMKRIRQTAQPSKQSLSDDSSDDDSDDEEEDKVVKKKGRDDDDSDDDEEDEMSDEDDGRRKKGRGRASPKNKKGSKPAASSSRRSSASKKKVEVDDDEDESSSDDDDRGDAAGLYKDEADRKRLKALPEFERERILAERFQEKVVREQQEKVKALARQKDREPPKKTTARGRRGSSGKPAAPPKKGRKDEASSSDEEELDDASGPSKPSAADEESIGSVSEDEEEEDDNRRVTRSGARKPAAREAESDDDEDIHISDDEEDEARQFKKSSSKVEEKKKDEDEYDEKAEVAKFDLIRALQLPRHVVIKWAHEPYFARAIKGSYVRCKTFAHSNEGSYKIYEILEPTPVNRPYTANAGRDRKVTLNVGLRVRNGAHEEVMLIRMVSEDKISEDDYNDWVETCREDRVKLPTPEQATTTLYNRKSLAKSYNYTDQDVQEMLDKKKKSKGTATVEEVKRLNVSRMKIELKKTNDLLEGELDNLRRQLEELEVAREKEKMDDDQYRTKKEEIQIKIKDLEKQLEINIKDFKTLTSVFDEKASLLHRTHKDWNDKVERNRKENETSQRKTKLVTMIEELASKGGKGSNVYDRIKTFSSVNYTVMANKRKEAEGEAEARALAPTNGNMEPEQRAAIRFPSHAKPEKADDVDPAFDPLSVISEESFDARKCGLGKYMPKKRRGLSSRRVSFKRTRLGMTAEEYDQMIVADRSRPGQDAEDDLMQE